MLILSIPGTGAAEFKKTKIAVLDFALQGEGFETKDMGAIVAEWFITAFVKVGRFDVVERSLLNKIMEEQKLGMTGMVDESTATQLGKILGVRAIISGSVLKLHNILEINARIIDVESASIRAAESVRSAQVDNLHDLVNQMSEIIIKNFPLQGYIVNKTDDRVTIDLGSSAGVKNGMEFITYREGKVIKHPKTGEVLDVETIETGRLTITRVRDKIAEAKITSEESPGAIEYGQMVSSVVKPQKVQSTIPQPSEPKGSRLYVTTVPENAQIRILNIVPPYQPGMMLDMGQYHVEISAPGYEKTDQWISIQSPGDKYITVTLKQAASTAAEAPEPGPGLSPEFRRIIAMLTSDNMKQKIRAAREVIRNHRTETVFLDVAKEELLKGYRVNNNTKDYVDAMSWLCNVLGESGDNSYKEILNQVYRGAAHNKLKKYALANYRKLR